MERKYQEIISALQEEVRVLKEELAQTRELLKEKDAVIAELKEPLRKHSQSLFNNFFRKLATSTTILL